MSASAVATRPADHSADDLDLVEAVRAGDDRAFELLYQRYHGRIVAFVRGKVRDNGRAEDITQEVFIAALRRIRETEREIAFRPWIYEIAKNACIDAFRRGRIASEVSFDAQEGLGASDHGRLAAHGAAPEAVIDSKLALDNLCGAFGGLSQTHHDILVMREFEGLSYREIGDRLGMSRAAVESTLFRARRRLSEEYEELISGERCVRVRGLVDAPAPRVIGLRDRRRMARHLSHCQPCRRYAHLAGADLEAIRGRRSVAARIAALVPLPAVLRRRIDVDATPIATAHAGPVTQWTASVATLDPTHVSGWAKAVATAATVAVAGLGAGAVVKGPDAVVDFVSHAPAIVGLAPDRPADAGGAPRNWSPIPAKAGRLPTAPPATGVGNPDASMATVTGPASGESAAGTTAGDGSATQAHGSGSARLPGASTVTDATPNGSGATSPAGSLPKLDGSRPRPSDGNGPVRELLENVGAGVTTGGTATTVTDVVTGLVSTVQQAVTTVTSSGGEAVATAEDSGASSDGTTVAQTTSETSSDPVGDVLTTVTGALGAPTPAATEAPAEFTELS